MPAPQNIVAIIFDFDDTLTDDSTTLFLKSKGVDAKDFWQNRLNKLVEGGWDPTQAYLKLFLDRVGAKKPFGRVSNQELREFGKTLKFYPGIPGIFRDLQELVKAHQVSKPTVEFYIISGGLEEIIRGSRIAKYFSGIYGCRFAEERGTIKHIKNVVSFTEKTKYVFEINKGIQDSRGKPFSVNQYIPPLERRIPFENMIYVGDGLTDVPCFSLIQQFDGKAFGVFNPAKKDSPKIAWKEFVVPQRVSNLSSPKYCRTDDMGSLLRTAAVSLCAEMDLRRRTF